MAEVFVDAVTYSEDDASEQRKNHQRDRKNQWFFLQYEAQDWEDPQPWLSVTDRFRQLCDPQQAGNRFSASQYPSFVSFIGDTGSGKSTMLRAMMMMGQVNACIRASQDENGNEIYQKLVEAKKHGPVTRSANTDDLTDPTSSGVHLYKDISLLQPDPASLQAQHDNDGSAAMCGASSPVLFADCEGFRGSITQTNSERAFVNGAPSLYSAQHLNAEPESHRKHHSATTSSSSRERPRSPRRPSFPKSEYAIYEKPIVAPGIRDKPGKKGGEIFYARFLYAVSDVLVFVTKSEQMLHNDLQRLMEWVASAVYNSVNHAVHKTLIIVRNMPERHNAVFYDSSNLERSLFQKMSPLWEGSPILNEFKRKHDAMFQYDNQKIHTNKDLFDKFFKSHEACYIPSNSKAPIEEIYRQYQSLRKQIDRASELSQDCRRRSWTQYNVPTLTHLLQRAFEHYRTLDRPFDFYTAARKDNPNPSSPADHIANFLSRTWALRDSELTMFKTVVSVSLVNYVLRNFTVPADPRDYFDRDLKEFCRQSLARFGDKYQNCAFRFDNLEQNTCIVKRPVHVEHCNRDGVRKPGEFADEMSRVRDSIMDAIWSQFSDSFHGMCPNRQELPTPKAASRQREELLGSFFRLWPRIKSNRTCFACLYQVPDHVLPCGHSLCAACVEEFGHPSPWFESCFLLDRCPLCQCPWPYRPPTFRLKPKCAGVRVLTLDGGGIRGVIELAILEQVVAELDRLYGIEIPIRELFDLIMGTSTGGIISLGLALRGDLRVGDMREKFTVLAKETFNSRRAGWLVTKLDPLQWVPRSLMIFKLTESLYPTKPLKQGLQDLFTEQRLLFSGAPDYREPRITRVAVTSAKDEAATACLITNYNRPQISVRTGSGALSWRSELERWNGDYSSTDFEREDREDKELKAWEAGLATSAAPFYFKPFNKTTTDRDYVDGAVHANLPISYALSEIKKIWPELGSSPPDLLVSVGTGNQESKLNFPNIFDIGGLQKLCNVFHQNLDTGRLWQEFREGHRNEPRLMERIHRLNADIAPPYVALNDYERMPELAASVQGQMQSAQSPLPRLVSRTADILVANLFFFEPASEEIDGLPPLAPGRAESPRRTFRLRGTVRCRLLRASPALKELTRRVARFAHKELLPDAAPYGDADGWTPQPVSDDVRAGVASGEDFLRVPVHVLVHEKEPVRQAFALVLRGREGEAPIPISGFPVTLNELCRRAGITAP